MQQSLPQEYLALCRQLGDAQQRCSATMAAQAGQIAALQAEVVRLRAQVIVRDTRLAMAHDALAQLAQAQPGLPRRIAMARHIGALAERIASLTRECLRWRLAAQASVAQPRPMPPQHTAQAGTHAGAPDSGAGPAPAHGLMDDTDALDASLAAADLVICQTGCISHHDYWRVQDHCRRTGKACILVDQPLAVREAQALAAFRPMVALRVVRPPRHRAVAAQTQAQDVAGEILDENGL